MRFRYGSLLAMFWQTVYHKDEHTGRHSTKGRIQTFRGFVMMLSMRLLALPFLLAAPAILAADTAPPLTCPATMTSGAKGQGATFEFERINIYNGKPGGEEYDLAPDGEGNSGGKITQTWVLKDYRSMNIFVRCRYRGTRAVTTMDVPAKLQKCTFTFELDKKNHITVKPEFSCK
jgi:hypothetical protein